MSSNQETYCTSNFMQVGLGVKARLHRKIRVLFLPLPPWLSAVEVKNGRIPL